MSTVTCHTPGCGNADIGLEMDLDPEMDGVTFHIDRVICGVCGQPIEDIKE